MEKPKILVITLADEIDDTLFIKELLENNGYNALFASDTRGALQISKDVLATVIHQPSLSQWEWLNALMKIRKEYPAHPVFVYSYEDILEDGFSSGIGDSCTYLFNDLRLLEKGLADYVTKKHESRKKVLFVDDDKDILKSYIRLLRKTPWEILTASSGEKALAVLQESQIDLIATDIKMPQMHGIELVTKIREHDKNIPIIICSGFQGLKEDANLKLHGVTDFVEKPVNTEALISKLEEMLGG